MAKSRNEGDPAIAWLMSISDSDERAHAARYSGYAYLDETPHPRFTQGAGPQASLNAAAFGTRGVQSGKTQERGSQ